jgi:gamma-glutamylputrescine oxidase
MEDDSRSQWGPSPWRRSSFRGIGFAEAKVSNLPDVAIVGAGLTGLSTAYHLARMGVRAVVFEAGRVGDGASGRTGGLVLEGTASGIREQVDSCVPGLKRLVDEENIDCDLELPGCWEIEHRISGQTKLLPWSDDGRPVAIAKTVAGGIVEPGLLTTGIAQAAVKLGSVVCEQARVSHVTVSPELSLEIENHRFTPKYIIIATNAWINALLPDTVKLHSSLTFACITEPLDRATLEAIGLGENIPFYTRDMPYLWGRGTKEGRVVFGAGLVFGDPNEIENIDIDRGSSAQITERLQVRVRGLNPALRDIGFDASWAGPIAFTDDSIPIIGAHPANRHILVAGAYAGHGVALSVRAGELLALTIVKNRELPKWGALLR